VSHIVSIKTEVRDSQAIAAACRRLGLPGPVHGTARLFGGEAAGLLVQQTDCCTPLVADTATGATSDASRFIEQAPGRRTTETLTAEHPPGPACRPNSGGRSEANIGLCLTE
jgi:hypothetical protein